MAVEKVRREIHQGANKIARGAHNYLTTREDVRVVLDAVQRVMGHARTAYNRIDPAFELMKEGYIQAATAGDGSRDGGIMRTSLDDMMPLLESMHQQRVALAKVVEAVEDLSATYGFGRYPEQLEADALAAGIIARNLHRGADQL